MKIKIYSFLLLLVSVTSCQISETIHLNEDGSGKIELMRLRDESSYMQVAGENYLKEEKFEDTTYVFKDFILKYKETFSRLPPFEQAIFQKFANVKVHVKKSSYEKEFRTKITQDFNRLIEVADLYKTEEYVDDIVNNYALTAEEHYYEVSYAFDGNLFERNVKITDLVELKKQQDVIENYKKQLFSFKINQPYILNYHFPRKIKSVSNKEAKISEDRKSLSLEFLLSDCLQNPELSNLKVVLE
jgi:hypothetical protein